MKSRCLTSKGITLPDGYDFSVSGNMKKILVIDNDYEIVELIADILSVNNFDVCTALNGSDGIKAAQHFNPDLILCDITMPELSGYEVLEALRHDKRTNFIPFIFLTAMDGMQALRKGMRLGADDYLTKPVMADELVATVRTRLEKHSQLTRRYRDEIEQTKYHLELTRNYDEKTGLPKRAVLERMIEKSLQNGSYRFSISLLVIKINRFNNIRDIIGKNKFLNLIHELSQRIENVSKTEKSIYSLNDTDLGLFLPEHLDKKHLTQVANKILKAIRKPLLVENQELNFSACIGVAPYETGIRSADDLISNAEIAAKAAVAEGFNTYYFFEELLKRNEIDRINLENALHRALEKNEFKLFYQPKFDLMNQIIIGAEALIRWDNSDYGLLSPTIFVPIAEENGLIIPIGEWIFESICHQLNAWKSNGLNPSPIAINISAKQLEHKNFVSSISSILEKSNVENSLLEIELTESILIKNSRRTSNKLSKLRRQGMKVAIDDFGTGYSSLAYLSNFPFDKLKIDQAFIRDITTDKTAASLATSIISMAHSLGVTVIAEGVETEEQVKFLRNYQCDEIQGYYLSEPVTAAEYTKLLSKQTSVA